MCRAETDPRNWLCFVTVEPGGTGFTAAYEERRRNVAAFDRLRASGTRSGVALTRTPRADAKATRPAPELNNRPKAPGLWLPAPAPGRATQATAAGSAVGRRRMSRTAARPARLAPMVLAEGP
ncbi:hypothetical protein QFZ63_006478 [Streptomyces sp. B3I7]|nr:hypothetical protein [Streptomyces sp. B3I7]